jgi:MFS family permease
VCGLACAVLAVDFTMRLLVIEVRTAKRYEMGDACENGTEALITGESQPQTEEGSDELSSLLQNTAKADDSYIISPDLPKVMRIVPILPCLASPRLIAALTIAFVQALLLGSIDATVPIVSHEYFNFSSLQAGLMFLPLGVANLTAGPFLGWYVDKLGTKKISVLVYLYLVPVLISFRFAKPGGASQVAVYEIMLGLLGIGVAGMGAPSIVEASTVVQKYHQANPDFFGDHGPYAQLYSLSFLFFSLGLALGPELAGELRQAIGYGNMNAVLAAVCALTALVCFLFIGEKPKKTILE